MAICIWCKCKFDVDDAKERIDEAFYPGAYDQNTWSGLCCYDCLFNDLGAAEGTYDEMADYMGSD